MPNDSSDEKRDEANLRSQLSREYNITFTSKDIHDAVITVATERSYHPIKQMLKNLPKWDKKPRVDTLFIDYLGAEDNIYVKEATRKTLVAAIRRVKEPGCKFDYVPILVGPQGIGKSTLCKQLGGEWHCDSLSFHDLKDKTGYEKIQGSWIVEFSELVGLNKSDLNIVKNFLTSTTDKYRGAYQSTTKERKRQNIFIGTTNAQDGFLSDTTGNRRFWPIKVEGADKTPFDLDKKTIQQIWAEALYCERQGEPLTLSKEAEQIATTEQRQALVHSDDSARIIEYLNLPLPIEWYDWNTAERIAYCKWKLDGIVPEPTEGNRISFSDFYDFIEENSHRKTMQREYVCRAEIYCECLGGNREEINKGNQTKKIDLMMQQIDDFEYQGKEKKRIGGYGSVNCYIRK